MVKKIDISELHEGMTVAEDVCSAFGTRIANKGQTVDSGIIALMKSNRVRSVKVIAGSSEQDEAENVIKLLAQSMLFARNKAVFASEEFVKPIIADVIGLVKSSPQALEYIDLLMRLRDYSETVFAHSVNVALICREFANWHGMNFEKTQELTLAGLIHDIGKLQVPVDILDSVRPLTEAEFKQVKKHSINGYMMLKGSEIPEIIKRPIIDHHERCDGTGYPMGYHFQEISEYGRIIGMVDAYEAMTAKRAYRDRLCPFKIGAIMLQESEGKYDTLLLEEFFANILNPYIGSKVMLSNGYTARLKGINKQDISHPVIELAGQTIDLSMANIKKSQIQVVGIVYE